MADAMADRAKPGLVRALAENLEALAIAIVMALILKYFLIEAYKIPTGSMQPGIMGDPNAGIFDRVLVNKLVYLLRDPERYEVVVFKNPLWQRQNYIKRLIGLPGERIGIRNGDVFVTPPAGAGGGREAIARKPDAVWRSVRKSQICERDGRIDLAQRFQVDGGDARIEGDRIVFAGSEPAAAIRTKDPIRDHYLDGYDPAWTAAYVRPTSPYSTAAHYAQLNTHDVTDAEIAADVTPRNDAQRIVFEIRESGRVHRAELPIGTGEGLVTTAFPEGDLSEWEDQAADVRVAPLRPGVTTRVSFRNVDDELVLELDDDVVLRRKYRTRGVDPDTDPKTRASYLTHAAIRATGSFTLTDVGLWRDIHYLPDGEPTGARSAVYAVEDGEYMVLGDNTQNSWDCRQWQMATYELADGTEISGNYFNNHGDVLPQWTPGTDSNPAIDRATIHFRSIYGQEYRFTRDDLKGDETRPETRDVHSFPKEYLLGKALAVFWPLPPVAPTWRLKWVR